MSFSDLKIKILNDKKIAEILKYYPHYSRGLVTVGEKEWCFIYKYLETGEEVYNFEPRPNDTWVVTYPRSGTTLTQELVWLVANDMNFDEARRKHLLDRFPFLETTAIVETEKFAKKDIDQENRLNNSMKFTEEQLSPRFIKSHMPLDLLPKVVKSDCKIIYVARNPRDVVVSWYYFQKSIEVVQYKGNFEQFCDLFMSDRVMYSPYWEHVKEGWAKRHRPNTLFIFYEDLVRDMPGNIRKVAAFYGKNYSEEQIVKLADHLNIDNFRKNDMVNIPSGGANIERKNFIRKGIVGGWKDHFTPEIEAKFNKWIADNTKDTDLIFPS